MPEVAVYNMEGEKVDTVALSDRVFGLEPNHDLMHKYVVMYLANQRQGTAATKNRSAVSGGGRKPWRQKGTGRARHGSIRSPLWVGGGVVFGPQPRDYRLSMPKKARQAATRSALSAKVKADEIVVVDELTFPEPKTRAVVSTLAKLNVTGKALIVSGAPDKNLWLSSRNIVGVTPVEAASLNAYLVLNHDYVVVTKDALAKIEEVLG